MDTEAESYLKRIAEQEKQFDALYRSAGDIFELPDCSMWVLYFLVSSKEPITQQDLVGKMMFPKQTINSAVMKLVKDGFLELSILPGMRNRKAILLTDAGKELANNTVVRLLNAELRAVEAMGDNRMEQFIFLYTELLDAMQEEFAKEGLFDKKHDG